MEALLSSVQWMVGKALAPVSDGLLEAWVASNKLELNIEALRTELLLVQATLENASRKQISGQAMEELLRMLRHSAHCAEDLLDEVDYFRIHDQLHGTYDAADQHAKGGVHDLALNARHTAKAVASKLVLLPSSSCCWSSSATSPGQEDNRSTGACCAWSRARQRPNANQLAGEEEAVSGCMPKLGKLLLCSSSPHVDDDNSAGQSTTLCDGSRRNHHVEKAVHTLGFNRVDVSERMKYIVDQLQPVRRDVTKILQSCDRIIVPDIAQSTRPITTAQSIEPKLYGRDRIMNSIIHDMTKGKYHSKDLTVLPIVGPGGIGKTTLIHHIYRSQQVQNHFQVVIWVCVSLSFSLNKLLEEIKTYIPRVEGEKDGSRPEELIEKRLKSKRFLLVLDDIWEISNGDDWKRLLLPLRASQEKGSMILLTTRFPAIANMVKTTNLIELEGLEFEEFRRLFLAFVFGDEPFRSDHNFLLKTGDKIMKKLKGSPLAAKTVGTLLRKDLNLRHWRRVLESKEWETQAGANDIMPALKLSYDYLPFHQQRCFSYSALFPEDYEYSTTDLINLWIGLDILQPGGRNQTLEDIGLSSLNDLVTHGIFREEETNSGPRYVMHDLLHDLALQVASHDCLVVHHSNVRSVEINPSICHLSMIINNDTSSHENFKSQLRKLKTRLEVKQLHTLMLFGEMDGIFANILGDFFREANALRILRLVNMSSSVESMLPNFSALVHLRYLCLGTNEGREMHLPLAISRFYHLSILDLGSWHRCRDLPKDLSNLAKLRHFYTPSDELHSDILNVGKLVLLEELKVFKVNKEKEGFEPKQLEHLSELRELGIYNLENIHTKEEAVKINLMEKNYLERLTLDWDSEQSNTEPGLEAVILESLQPHRYLQELCIRGHRSPSCPTWLGDELAVEVLQSLHLVGVSWEYLPCLGKMWDLDKLILERIDAVKVFVIEQSFCRLIRLELVHLKSFEKWVPPSEDAHMFPLLQILIIRFCPKLSGLPFSNCTVYPPSTDQDWNVGWFPKLQELEIEYCPEFLLVTQIPWTETLYRVDIFEIKLVQLLQYCSRSSILYITGKDGLHSLDDALAFNKLTGLEQLTIKKCPPLESKNLLMLTSLKELNTDSSDGLVGPLEGEAGDVEWQHPVEHLGVEEFGGASGKEWTKLLTHLPRLSKLKFVRCTNMTQLAVGVDLEQTTSAAEVELEKEEDGLLLIPAHFSGSLRELVFHDCPELVLVDYPSTFLAASNKTGGGFQALRSLQRLQIFLSPKILPAGSFSSCLFPSSLQELHIFDVEGIREGMVTLEHLSNLTSLTRLELWSPRWDLRCKGLEPLLTGGGQLRELIVRGSPRFFAGWSHPSPSPRVLLQNGEEQQQQLVSSKLQYLCTDDMGGLLAVPICSLLSSSLTHLHLRDNQDMERFCKEQEDAFQLLASLQNLEFFFCYKLQHLPTGLHMLANLKRLTVHDCPALRSLPKDGLPKSLQELSVSLCGNQELIQQCRRLVGTIPKVHY